MNQSWTKGASRRDGGMRGGGRRSWEGKGGEGRCLKREGREMDGSETKKNTSVVISSKGFHLGRA